MLPAQFRDVLLQRVCRESPRSPCPHAEFGSSLSDDRTTKDIADRLFHAPPLTAGQLHSFSRTSFSRLRTMS